MDPNSDVRLMQSRSMGGMGGKSRGRVNRGAAAHYRGQRNIRQRQIAHGQIGASHKVASDIGESSLDGMMLGHVLKSVMKEATDDGDWIDKLHHRYTAVLFVTLAVLVSTKQYVGEPINCWCPAHFSRAWVEYTNNICWISNTYYIPVQYDVKFAKDIHSQSDIKYYQWIPLLISMQGLMFYIPRIVWKALSLSAGIDIAKLVTYLTTFESVLDPDRWEKTLSYTAVHLDRFCNTQRDINTGIRSRIRRYLTKIFFPVCSRRYGNVLIIDYVMCKLLYLLNVVVQLFALDLWLGAKYHQYGIEVAVKIFNSIPWTGGPRFPQVTLCDFSTRSLGTNHNFTVQCVLTINIFNEKIYLLVWFWLVFVGLLTCFNLLEWLFRITVFFDRSNYIKKHLKFADRYTTEEDKKMCKKFIECYLKADGIFVIRLLSKNTNSILVSELVAHLWDTFRVKMHTGTIHHGSAGAGSAGAQAGQQTGLHCDSPTGDHHSDNHHDPHSDHHHRTGPGGGDHSGSGGEGDSSPTHTNKHDSHYERRDTIRSGSPESLHTVKKVCTWRPTSRRRTSFFDREKGSLEKNKKEFSNGDKFSLSGGGGGLKCASSADAAATAEPLLLQPPPSISIKHNLRPLEPSTPRPAAEYPRPPGAPLTGSSSPGAGGHTSSATFPRNSSISAPPSAATAGLHKEEKKPEFLAGM